MSLLTVSAAYAQIFTQAYTTPTSDGSTTFLIPDGVTSIQIQAWGGGGAGARGGNGGGQGGVAGGQGAFINSPGGSGGGGGTFLSPGAGGAGNRGTGASGIGMSGGGNTSSSSTSNSGGGGGGGYFGGGQGGTSGGSNFAAGGGGGGSSFVFAFASDAVLIGGSGSSAGNAASLDYVSGTSVGSAGISGAGLVANGGNGEVFLRYTVVAAVVPEASTLAFALPALGMIGAVVIRRRKTAK